ncbi:MAG: HlyD family efflux transporter periplasmic adaptor subunit [Cyanobacteria bacterium J06656_5]
MNLQSDVPPPINPAALGEVIPADFLPPIHRWQRLGGLAGVITLGTALVLSRIITFRETVKAPVIVRPQGELRLVEAAVPGRVSQIVVQENDWVNAGDAIAYLDATRLQNETVQLQTSALQTRHQLEQIDYQLQSLEQRRVATRERTQGSLRAATAELTLAQKQLRERQLVNQTDLRQLQTEIDLAQENVNRYRQLVEQGAISISQLRDYEVALAAALANFEKASVTAHPSQADVTIAQQQIIQTQAQGSATLAQLQQEANTLEQQKSNLLNQLNKIQQDLAQTEADSALLVLRAPVSGIIQTLGLRNHNQVVALGAPIAQIAANDEPLIAKAWVNSKDINTLELKQAARLRISACPYTDYGTLEATVQSISPDTLSPQALPNEIATMASEGLYEGLYEVTLQLSQATLRTDTLACPLQAGMTGQADILTREDTILKIVGRKLRLTTQL